ncbi:hypothetical protein [Methylobacterium fujisawaense]|uniref:hypothetical protein n=1 Tax=Methylobacterium fujisawaense TaxID=107400 RepID=UPI0037017CB4
MHVAAAGRAMPDVHYHLGRQAWSIRERGRVIGHAASVALRDVTFRVSGPGVDRIRRRGQREVVAHARGVLTESGPVPEGAQRVRFDPYAAASFTLSDGSPIAAAALILFLPDGSCWAVPVPSECPHA